MIVKLKEVIRNETNRAYNKTPLGQPRYVTRDIFLNPEHVQLIRTNEQMIGQLREGAIRNVEPSAEFSTISLTNHQAEIVVVGSVEEVRESLWKGRRLLNG